MSTRRTRLLALFVGLSLVSFLFLHVYIHFIHPPVSEPLDGPFPEQTGIPVVHNENDGAIPTDALQHQQQQETLAPPILLVSAFFPLPKSKHPDSDYNYWLSTFLNSISTPIYFFTTPSMEPLIRSLRSSTRDLPITINTTFASSFDVPPLKGLEHRYEAMHAQDRERGRHAPGLYAVWNAKPFFLDEGLKNARRECVGGGEDGRGCEYEYAFWSDAGSFRSGDHVYREWPDGRRVREVWREGAGRVSDLTVNAQVGQVKEEDLFFVPMWQPPSRRMKGWKESMGPVDTEFSEGSFFGGPPASVHWWRTTFYAYHDFYLAQGHFVGKDQTIMNAILMLFPSRVLTMWLGDPEWGTDTGGGVNTTMSKWGGGRRRMRCGSEWYYYQFFFAGLEEREKMRRVWDDAAVAAAAASKAKGWSWREIWDWVYEWDWELVWDSIWEWQWKERQSCELRETLSVWGLLKRVFGGGWKSPAKSLELVPVET